MGGKELHGLLHRHGENLANRLAIVLHLEGLAVEACPSAVLARHVGDREEVHLKLDDPLSLAGFAAASVVIERESAAGVAAQARLRQSCVERADRVEDLEVGRGGRARGLSDGGLVHLDHLREMLGPGDRFPVLRAALLAAPGARERFLDGGEKDASEQGALAGAADAGDGREPSEREAGIDAGEVVALGTLELQPVGDLAHRAS